MKYISLIDQLDITLDDIVHIDTTQIIRLQKQLQTKAIPDNTNTLGELSERLGQLEKQEVKEAHLFIESHLWLKKILLGEHETLDVKAFDSTYNPRKAAAYTKAFITPFLLQSLTATLSYLFSKEKLHLVIRIVSQERFFSEEVKQEITTFFATQLNDAKSYITQGKLKESQHPVAFLKNPHFIESVNRYITALTNELTKVHDTILHIYNRNQGAVHDEWDFAITTMIAFGKLIPSNQKLQEVFTQNASIAKSSTFKSGLLELEERTPKKSRSQNTYPIIIITTILFFIIIGITILMSNSDPSNDYDQDDNNDIYSEKNDKESQEDAYPPSDELLISEEKEEVLTETINSEIHTEEEEEKEEENNTTLEETIQPPISEYITLPNKAKAYTRDNHIRFLYSLKRRVVKGDDKEPEEIIKITPFTNPYPKTFNTIATDATHSDAQLEIKNSTQKELIIFKLQNGIDEAIIIPENKKGTLNFKQGDSIVFYTGNDFTSSRFSHFTKEQDVSRIYKITSVTKNSKIDVLPFKDNSGSAKNSKFYRNIESLTFYDVKTEKLKTIETLYRNYYNTHYQK